MDNTLALQNRFASQFANIIYLESPACVGFSYSETDNCASDDDLTSEQNYNALKDFFEKVNVNT